ncbi:MAG: hypothetical protein Q4C70_15175, partial [Planctomycetia bacterium]|nr:hypothetical protein [Planctomycetia bacterium]
VASESTATTEEAPAEAVAETAEVVEAAPAATEFALPAWSDPALAKSAWLCLDLSRYVTKPDPNAPVAADLNQYAGEDNVLTLAELDAVPAEGLNFGGTVYTADMLKSMLKQVATKVKGEEVADADVAVTLKDYQKLQCNDWAKIYQIPMIMMGAAFVILLLFGKNPEAISEGTDGIAK